MLAGRHRFQWKDKPPLYWTILFLVYFLTTFVWLGIHFTVANIAPQIPDSVRSRAISESGKTYYVRPLVGWFADEGGWFLGAMLFTLALVMWLKRDRVEKTQ